MITKTVFITMPTYKRKKVIDLTLEKLLPAISNKDFNVTFCLYDNNSSEETANIIYRYKKLFEKVNIKCNFVFDKENKGKAWALDYMKERFYEGQDMIITMDNDIVFGDGIDFLDELYTLIGHLPEDWEICAIRSGRFTFENPCHGKDINEIKYKNKIYAIRPTSCMSGAFMAIRKDIYRIINYPEKDTIVLGNDDGHVSSLSDKKYVIITEDLNFAIHDPLCGRFTDGSLGINNIKDEELIKYQTAKQKLRQNNIWAFERGWDE